MTPFVRSIIETLVATAAAQGQLSINNKTDRRRTIAAQCARKERHKYESRSNTKASRS